MQKIMQKWGLVLLACWLTMLGMGLQAQAVYNAPSSGASSQSAQVVYASKAGVTMDSNVITGGGTDNTTALQTILNKASAGVPLELVMDGAALTGGLTIYGNTTIRCLNQSCGFFLKTNANVGLLNNAHPTRSGTPVDSNITLIGGTYNGNGAPVGSSDGTTFNQIKSSATLGWAVSTTCGIFGVEQCLVDSVTFLNARSFAFMASNARHLTVRNCHVLFTAPNLSSNNDGIHILGNSQYVNIIGNYINTQDDAIAINADEPRIPGYDPIDVAPYVVNGPISNVVMRDNHLEQCQFGIRLLSISSRLDAINIDGLDGTCSGQWLNIDYFFGQSQTTHGNIGNVICSNVSVVCNRVNVTAANYEYCGAFINCPVENIVFDNCSRQNWPDNRPYIRTSKYGAVQNMTIRGYAARDGSLVGGSHFYIGGTVGTLAISNAAILRPGASSAVDCSLVYIDPVNNTIDTAGAGSGANGVTNLLMSNIYSEWSPTLVNNVSGTLSNVLSQNVKLANSGGTPAPIKLQSNTTADLYLSGYAGATPIVSLSGSGTTTVQRGDAFVSSGSLTSNTLTSANVLATSATLNWTATTGGTAPYTYDLKRSASSAMTSPTSLVTGGSVLTYSDTGLTAGTTYYYQVTSHDAASGVATSNVLQVITPVFVDTFASNTSATNYYLTGAASTNFAASSNTLTYTPTTLNDGLYAFMYVSPGAGTQAGELLVGASKTMQYTTNNFDVGIRFNVVDANNYWTLYYGTAGTCAYYQVVAGSATQQGGSVNFSAGTHTLKVVVDSAGNTTCYMDSTQIGTVGTGFTTARPVVITLGDTSAKAISNVRITSP